VIGPKPKLLDVFLPPQPTRRPILKGKKKKKRIWLVGWNHRYQWNIEMRVVIDANYFFNNRGTWQKKLNEFIIFPIQTCQIISWRRQKKGHGGPIIKGWKAKKYDSLFDRD